MRLYRSKFSCFLFLFLNAAHSCTFFAHATDDSDKLVLAALALIIVLEIIERCVRSFFFDIPWSKFYQRTCEKIFSNRQKNVLPISLAPTPPHSAPNSSEGKGILNRGKNNLYRRPPHTHVVIDTGVTFEPETQPLLANSKQNRNSNSRGFAKTHLKKHNLNQINTYDLLKIVCTITMFIDHYGYFGLPGMPAFLPSFPSILSIL